MSDVAKAHVARLYFLGDLTKQQIAQRLGISRFKVARLLDQARAEGIVRFDIRDPVDVADELSRRVQDEFGLDLAVVVRDGGDPGAVARAAAAWLPELLPARAPLGVSWGTTLQQIADALPAGAAAGVPVVQVCGAIPGLQPGTGPVELALRFAERLGGPLYALPAPALSSRGARDELLANDAVRPTVEMFDRIGLALVGIGAGSRFPSAPRGAAGHLLVHVFDADGAFLETGEVADRAIAMSVKQISRARVLAAARGEGKERAILGALRTGLIDALVTDEQGARVALEGAAG
jgi:DNA-binding transcriptional regulator LsrR (DeoR family)